MCTNISTRTVKLQLSERREILPFSFSFSFPFPFLFSFPSLSTNSFFFPLRILFFFLLLSFFSFIFCFSLFFFSHYFFSSFSLSHLFILIFFFLLAFSPLFIFFIIDRLLKEGSFLPLSSCHLSGPQFSFLFLNSFISFYCIINHVVNCKPHIEVHHIALAMCHSLPITMPCVIRHPTLQKTYNSVCLRIQQNFTW